MLMLSKATSTDSSHINGGLWVVREVHIICKECHKNIGKRYNYKQNNMGWAGQQLLWFCAKGK